jgi:hypothetical protein
MIDISQFDKAEVLVALFNRSQQQGMGFLDRSGALPLTLPEARKALDERKSNGLYFDYFRGRVLKVDLGGDQFDPYLYDRDNGNGAAARAIATLRECTNA